MYNQPYFIPGYMSSFSPSMMRGVVSGPLGRTAGGLVNGASKGLGLFGRLGSSMQALKNINWGGLITNTSKTLNVVNQAIPLVKQVGPMFNNMRSMLRIASIFKDETDGNVKVKNNHYLNNNTYKDNSIKVANSLDNVTVSRNNSYNSINDNSPTFFVEA